MWFWGLPNGSDGKESVSNAEDPGSIPGSGRFPWRRKWQPTPVFLPGESHEQRSLARGLMRPWGRKESDMTEWLTFTSFILNSAIHQHEAAKESPPTPSYPSRLSQSTRFELPVSYSKFPLAIYFTYDKVYVSILLPIHPTLSFPNCVHKSVLWISIDALQIGWPVASF